MNSQIRAPIVRVIGEKGENFGELPILEALKLAYDQNLDLVEISPNATPPITKIIDYGKFKYNKEKKEREKNKHQKEVELKTIRISVTIGQHDKELRAKMAKEFMEEGNKVFIAMVLRGRQKANRAFAEQKFREFAKLLGDVTYEQPIKQGPQGLSMIVTKKQEK